MIIRILHHSYFIYHQLKENGYNFSELIINPIIVISFCICHIFIQMSNNYYKPLEIHSNIFLHIIVGGILGIIIIIITFVFERSFVNDLYRILTNNQIKSD